MSDTPKHTPGPLRVKKLTSPRQFEVISDYSSINGEFEDRYLLFSGYFGSYGPYMFAAAPEMLEALEMVIAFEDWERYSHPDHKDALQYAEVVDRVRSAIAKAKGEQP